MTTQSAEALQRIASPVPFRMKARRAIWSVVERTAFRFSPHTSNRFRSVLLRLFGATIGNHCTIRRTARIYYPWLLSLGDLSALGENATIYNLGQITIGCKVTISQEAYVCAGTHDYRLLSMPLVTLPITIGDDVWICARAFVGPGVTVGAGAILAACAVAFQDVDAWSVYMGNPASKKKDRPKPH
jgi:putative colanic acid biosynthesis acetyltransferase WcaF